jgi:hypothetical protein
MRSMTKGPSPYSISHSSGIIRMAMPYTFMHMAQGTEKKAQLFQIWENITDLVASRCAALKIDFCFTYGIYPVENTKLGYPQK